MGRETGEEYDVVIVGGGLVGATLAVALANGQKTVALIEATPFPKSEPAWDERNLAINAASRRIFEGLGIWPALQADAEPILSTHISEQGRFGVARFTAEEAGEPALGYNVPVRAMATALQQRMMAAGNISVLCPGMVRQLEQSEEFVSLGLDPRLTPYASRLTARLVIAADGAQSAIRKLLGIGAEERDYDQVAIAGAVRPERPHRGVAYERFTPDGPIALLPRPDQRCTLVWTVPTGKAGKIMAWSDEEFLRQLQEHFGHRLGKLLESGRRQSYPLRRVMSQRITAPRVIFAGNAAQTLHPVAAQGFNLGLRDVATVAELIAGASDPGAPLLLVEYESRRAKDRENVSSFTDRLVRLFSNAVPGLSDARHLGLLALDLLPPFKDAVMRQNLGYAGNTPALVRSPSPGASRPPSPSRGEG